MSGKDVKSDVKVNSLITLNTPHKGSILASYGVLARQMAWYQSVNSSDPTLINFISVLEGPWYCDLTPERASDFVSNAILPRGIDTASVATNADRDGNHIIEGHEGDGFYLNSAADLSYQVVGTTTDVTLTIIPSNKFYLPDEFVFERVNSSGFMDNDIIVTQDSAARYKGYKDIDNLNHLNVHSQSTATAIVNDARSPNGNVNWSVK
jgi:hypothetical protein